MKSLITTRRICLLLASLYALTGVSSVFAVAGDTISNMATISYSVGGTAQAVIESSPTGNNTSGVGNGTATSFVEDRRINFSVVEAGTIGYATAAPGQNDIALQFTVTNSSNQILDFLLAAIDTDLNTHSGGAADNFDATGVQVFVESGATAGYQAAQDTAVYVDELAVGGSSTVYIIGDIPAGALNSQTAGYALVAQVAAGGAAATQGTAITNDDNNQISPAGTYSNGGTSVVAGTANNVADNPATVQTVFNDPAGGAAEDWSSAGATDVARNGQAADSDAYQVNAATLTVTKTSSVLSDPVNGASNPKSIPGAIVQYTVTIANGAGAATAQGVLITDSLDTEITAGNLAFDTNGYGAGTGIRVTAPDINGGAPLALTNAADADAGDFTANVVSTNVGNLDAGESATVTFRVVVQ
jgi:hypothetical protein